MNRLSILQSLRLASPQRPALVLALSAALAAACGGSHTTRGHSDGGTGGEAGSSPGGTAGSGGAGATGGVSGVGAAGGTGGTGAAGSGASGGSAGQTSGGSAGMAGSGGSAGATAGSGGALLCGNGKLDVGETCDPSIPVAQADMSGGGAGGTSGGTGGSSGAGASGGIGGAAGASAGTGGSAGAGGTTGGNGGTSAGTGGTSSGSGGTSSGSGGAGGTTAGTGGTAGSSGGTGGALPFGQCVTLAQCPSPSSACMRPVLTGSPSSCDVACSEAPLTQCVDDDGCCAPGCAPSEDNDCSGWSCHPSAPLDAVRYSAMENLSKDALRSALLARVSGHTSLGYDGARDYMFNTLDVHAGELECIYSGRLTPPDGTRTPGGFNTEHSWPQSMGADKEPAHSDLHHLFPTDGGTNSARSNWPFGDTVCGGSACPYHNGGSERGTDASGATVWEVRPARRGDIARAMFYFSVRYAMPLDPAQETALRAWHCQDPPDDLERGRNDGIDAVQHNRNPFIDRPDFVDRLLDF